MVRSSPELLAGTRELGKADDLVACLFPQSAGRGPEEIGPAFAMTAAGVDAFFLLAQPTFTNARPVLQRVRCTASRPGLTGLTYLEKR